jgi:hypothetical protein
MPNSAGILTIEKDELTEFTPQLARHVGGFIELRRRGRHGIVHGSE